MEGGARIDAPRDLRLFVPASWPPSGAAVLFHGGAWRAGSPEQLVPQCRAFAAAGVLAASAAYPLLGAVASSLSECVADVRMTMASFMRLAVAAGVEEGRVAAGGASSGGHLALTAALTWEGDSRTQGSDLPGCLVLFNPPTDLCCGRPATGSWADVEPSEHEARAMSPVHLVHSGAPRTIVFHGDADDVVPVEEARVFSSAMTAVGVPCRLVEFEGVGHGFFNHESWPYRNGPPDGGAAFHKTVQLSVSFIHEEPGDPRMSGAAVSEDTQVGKKYHS